MPWVRRRYRKNKVYVEVDASDALVLDARGFAKVRYKPDDEREYTAKPAEIGPVDPPVGEAASDGTAPPPARPTRRASAAKGRPSEGPTAAPTPPTEADAVSERPGDDVPALAGLAIHAYTDGASLGNPGPAGAGVVLLFREHRKEASIYLGETTNNVAELTAILEALRMVKRRDLPVRVHSDSSYAIGVLVGSHRAKANRELVDAIRAEMRAFPNLRLVKVEAHVGIEENERADELAGRAAKARRSGAPGR